MMKFKKWKMAGKWTVVVDQSKYSMEITGCHTGNELMKGWRLDVIDNPVINQYMKWYKR